MTHSEAERAWRRATDALLCESESWGVTAWCMGGWRAWIKEAVARMIQRACG